MTFRTSISARNVALDAIAALANGGKLRFYTGSLPANPETAASGTLLCELTLNATAFASASAGAMVANAITGDPVADASGPAGWARVFRADGVTAIFDGDITIIGGGGFIELGTVTTDVVAGAVVDCTGLTITLPQ
jgi:hypothetical protein